MRPLWRSDAHPIVRRVAGRLMLDAAAVAVGFGVFALVWLIFSCEG